MKKKVKQKTKKAITKRFKITRTGKILRGKQNSRHLRIKKSASQKRRFRKTTEVKGKFAKMIKKLI